MNKGERQYQAVDDQLTDIFEHSEDSVMIEFKIKSSSGIVANRNFVFSKGVGEERLNTMIETITNDLKEDIKRAVK